MITRRQAASSTAVASRKLGIIRQNPGSRHRAIVRCPAPRSRRRRGVLKKSPNRAIRQGAERGKLEPSQPRLADVDAPSFLTDDSAPRPVAIPAFDWPLPVRPASLPRVESRAPTPPGEDQSQGATATGHVARLHETVLDQLSLAVLVVDAAALLRYANRAARELLADGGPIRLGEGQIRGAHAGQERLPLELICRCRASRGPQGAMLGESSAQQGFWTTVSPLYAEFEAPQPNPGALYLMQLTAPWRQLPWEFAMISQSFDLTVAEAQVVCALADGMSVEDFVQRSGLDAEEVRQRLRSALNKTGLRAQSELVQVMGRVSPLAAITTPDAAAGVVPERWGSSFT